MNLKQDKKLNKSFQKDVIWNGKIKIVSRRNNFLHNTCEKQIVKTYSLIFPSTTREMQSPLPLTKASLLMKGEQGKETS